jgi:ribosomal protein S27E
MNALVAADLDVRKTGCPATALHWGTARKVWWRCRVTDCQHRWAATVASRTKLNARCPACTGRVATATDNLTITHAHLVREWSPRNADRPTDVRRASNARRWWRCLQCLWEYEAKVADRTSKRPRGCPGCAGRVVTPANALASNFPAIARDWDPVANHPLRPNAIVAGSHRLVWWRCRACDHQWEASPKHRTGRGGRGCPACANHVVTAANNAGVLAPQLLGEWSPRNTDTLWDVVPGSQRRRWWRCADCAHEWRTTVYSRAIAGTGCLVCLGRLATPATCLAATHPHLAAEWDAAANPDTPFDVVAGTNARRHWCCGICGHRFATAVANRGVRGTGCEACTLQHTSVLEIRIRHELVAATGWHSRTLAVPMTRRMSAVDIVLEAPSGRPPQRMAFEIDGAYYHRGRIADDQQKTAAIEACGIPVIRLRLDGLPAITAHDVCATSARGVRALVLALLEAMERRLQRPVAGLARYRRRVGLQGVADADAEIARRRDFERTILETFEGGRANTHGMGEAGLARAWFKAPPIIRDAPLFAAAVATKQL